MKKIKFLYVCGTNFKGTHDFHVSFGDFLTQIKGRNATGKTSVFDCIWWVMFDKDSLGNTKFETRELDADGNKVHHTEIVGEISMEVDGVSYVITKVQKERWVKKRGQESQEYSGNINEYSINGYPKTEKEYKAFIASIVDEQIFKILTNPIVFPNLDWKEQRRILFSIIGEIDDSDIKSDFLDILKPELAVASIDDIKRKYVKAKNELKKKPDEIQTRIDEVSKQIVEVDTTPLEQEKQTLLGLIKDNEGKIVELSEMNNSVIDGQIAELQSKQRIILSQANEDRNRAVREADRKREDITHEYKNVCTTLQRLNAEITRVDDEKRQRIMQLQDAKDKLENAKKAVFPKSKGVCPTCGQDLPKEQYEKAKSEWEAKRDEYVTTLNKNIDLLTENVKQREKLLVKISDDITKVESQEKTLNVEYEKALKEWEDLRQKPEVKGSEIAEYIELDSQILDLEKQKVDVTAIEVEKQELKAGIMHLMSKVSDIDAKIKSAENVSIYKARVSELQEELREVGQRISNCDQMLYAVDEYVKAISQKINDKFEGLHFRLFENQINGGVKETCSITLNGVPYESLNSGHKIIVGLDIIKVLRDYYEVETPIIIDNAETISDGNLPFMEGQVILLRVTSDPELTVV